MKEALSRLDADKWHKDIKVEMDAMHSNNVWKLVGTQKEKILYSVIGYFIRRNLMVLLDYIKSDWWQKFFNNKVDFGLLYSKQNLKCIGFSDAELEINLIENLLLVTVLSLVVVLFLGDQVNKLL